MRTHIIFVTLAAALLATVGVLADQPQKSVSSPEMAPTLEEHFAKMDANHDGIVSLTEFVNAYKEPTTRWAKAGFKKMGGKELTLEQYLKARSDWEREYAAHHPEWKPRPNAAELFRTMDTNKDGKLSESEFVSYWNEWATDRAMIAYAEMGGSQDKGLTFAQYERGVKDLEAPQFHLTGYEKVK